MIRSTRKDEESQILSLAEATGLFESDQLDMLREMFHATVNATGEKNEIPFWLTDDDNGVVGLAYCEPERMTDGTWNLQLIGVHPTRQKEKRGKSILSHVELEVIGRGARILIVETAGIPEFDYVRKFYEKNGYAKEATIRDFYADKVDKVTYRKSFPVNQQPEQT